jgi:hypothetical protein
MAKLSEKTKTTYTLTMGPEKARVLFALVNNVAGNEHAYRLCGAFERLLGDDYIDNLSVSAKYDADANLSILVSEV